MKLLDLELQEVSDWFGLGLHLDIPPPELYNIKHNITLRSPQEFRTEMFSVWMRKLPEPTWPRVVKALMEIGRERLAHKIALKYGKISLLYISISSVYMSLLRDNLHIYNPPIHCRGSSPICGRQEAATTRYLKPGMNVLG